MSRLISMLLVTTLLSTMAPAAFAADMARQGSTEQMQFVSGKYHLADGRYALLITKNNRLYLKVDEHADLLEPTGPASWVTKDRKTTVVFKQTLADDEIVLDFQDNAPLAAPTRLASNDKRGRGAVD